MILTGKKNRVTLKLSMEKRIVKSLIKLREFVNASILDQKFIKANRLELAKFYSI